MSGTADDGRDDRSLGDEHEASSGSIDDVVGGDGLWGLDAADPFADSADWFSAELENVSAADWDIDAEQLWGDESGSAAAADGEIDFPL